MNNKLIVNILIVGLVVLFGIFISQSSVYKGGDKDKSTQNNFIPKQIVSDLVFKDGLYEYSGSIEFPTACWSLSSEALVRESFPEQVTLQFEAKDLAVDSLCAQVITPIDFRILFNASGQASVDATFNGEPINLVIISDELQEATSTDQT